MLVLEALQRGGNASEIKCGFLYLFFFYGFEWIWEDSYTVNWKEVQKIVRKENFNFLTGNNILENYYFKITSAVFCLTSDFLYIDFGAENHHNNAPHGILLHFENIVLYLNHTFKSLRSKYRRK